MFLFRYAFPFIKNVLKTRSDARHLKHYHLSHFSLASALFVYFIHTYDLLSATVETRTENTWVLFGGLTAASDEYES